MLIAAGSVELERRRASRPGAAVTGLRLAWQRIWRYGGLAVVSLLLMAVAWPLASIDSPLGRVEIGANGESREEIGWHELVQTVAGIRDSVPAAERAGTGILASNYGEAAAIDLYGPAYGLPAAISGINTYWLRGYGNPPPQTLITLGFSQQELAQIFQSCRLAGRVTNRYGVQNEETGHPDIYVCQNLRAPWPEFWKGFRSFG